MSQRLLKDGTRPAYRVIRIANLPIYLQRQAMHAANHTPFDGLTWAANHDETVQNRRATWSVSVRPGVLLDYLPFHLGARKIFLYKLHTGQVATFTGTQSDLVTLVVSVEAVMTDHRCVFTDGHPLSCL